MSGKYLEKYSYLLEKRKKSKIRIMDIKRLQHLIDEAFEREEKAKVDMRVTNR